MAACESSSDEESSSSQVSMRDYYGNDIEYEEKMQCIDQMLSSSIEGHFGRWHQFKAEACVAGYNKHDQKIDNNVMIKNHANPEDSAEPVSLLSGIVVLNNKPFRIVLFHYSCPLVLKIMKNYVNKQKLQVLKYPNNATLFLSVLSFVTSICISSSDDDTAIASSKSSKQQVSTLTDGCMTAAFNDVNSLHLPKHVTVNHCGTLKDGIKYYFKTALKGACSNTNEMKTAAYNVNINNSQNNDKEADNLGFCVLTEPYDNARIPRHFVSDRCYVAEPYVNMLLLCQPHRMAGLLDQSQEQNQNL